MSRCACFLFAALALTACGDKTDRLQDGGGFVLPDSGPYDAGTRDAFVEDSGPFVCDPACNAGESCGCVGEPTPSCGCHPPGRYNASCDPQSPNSCLASFECVPERIADQTWDRCSDGRLASACSHAHDICDTVLGCLCLTDPTGVTECRCVDQADPNATLCDRMVPESCPGGACIRTAGGGGEIYFFCSHGAEGDPCEAGIDSCNTSLGCACPFIAGRERCSCMEPGAEGAPCDPSLAGSCTAPLVCQPQFDPINGNRTVCAAATGADGGASDQCDPGDPTSCPEGFTCSRQGGVYICVPIS